MEHKRLMHKINRLSTVHRLTVFKIVNTYGLHPGQFPILEFIRHHEPCTQKDIADFLRVSPPSIAVSVRRMEKVGLIERTCDPNDQRFNRLSITPQGQEVAIQALTEFRALDERLFAAFTTEEYQQFEQYLERLIQNLDVQEFQDATYFSLIQQEKEYRRQAEEESSDD
jgi:DNA-binding MarR family transcriptional regulator